jgi:phosphate-selective porin OprO/OprP
VFKDAGSYGDSENNDDFSITGRITGLPWMQDKTHFVHVGAAASYRNLDSDANTLRYRERPEVHQSLRYVDTASQIYGVNDYFLVGLEAAVVYGPWSAQGEYIMSNINTDMSDDPTMAGWYIQGSYFLTGESRAYKASSGTFDKVKPNENFSFSEGGGPGAWELALRWSSLDLDDSGVMGGTQDDITAGVTWYLNPNLKVMLNYIHAMAERDAVGSDPAYDGNFDAIQGRVQVFW